MASSEPLTAPLHRGMPDVHVTEDRAEETADAGAGPADDAVEKGLIGISLESLDLDLQHSQSYGMQIAPGGCISNPGGPPC